MSAWTISRLVSPPLKPAPRHYCSRFVGKRPEGVSAYTPLGAAEVERELDKADR